MTESKKNQLITEVCDNIEGKGPSVKPVQENTLGQPIPIRKMEDESAKRYEKDESKKDN